MTCIVSGADTIGWQINGGRIESWHITSLPRISTYLDHNEIYFNNSIRIGNSSSGAEGEVTSRLVGTIDQGLHSGDNITCLGTGTTPIPEIKSQTLRYFIAAGEILMLLYNYNVIHDIIILCRSSSTHTN